MTQSSQATVGFVGVGLLWLAFLLNLFGLLRTEGYPYTLLNLVGASLAGYSSYLIDFETGLHPVGALSETSPRTATSSSGPLRTRRPSSRTPGSAARCSSGTPCA